MTSALAGLAASIASGRQGVLRAGLPIAGAIPGHIGGAIGEDHVLHRGALFARPLHHLAGQIQCGSHGCGTTAWQRGKGFLCAHQRAGGRQQEFRGLVS